MLEQIAKKAAKETGIRIYEKMVQRVLVAIEKESNFWSIIDRADLPVPAASSIIKYLIEEGLVEIKDEKIYLTEKGKDLIKELGLKLGEHFCPVCEGRGYFWAKPEEREFYKKFLLIQQDRPLPIQDFDQAFVTPECTVSRVLFADRKGDIYNKKILVMGDDDLIGLALGLWGTAKEVRVIEVDERIVEFTNKRAKEWGLNVKAEIFDLRQPLPDDMFGKYDVFFTDPPETVPAIKAFVHRGIAALKEPGSAGYFGFTLRDSSLNRWHILQTFLLEQGAVITDIIYNFNEYVNWGYHEETKARRVAPVSIKPERNWYRSSMYRIELLPGFRRVNEKIEVDRELYVDAEGSTT